MLSRLIWCEGSVAPTPGALRGQRPRELHREQQSLARGVRRSHRRPAASAAEIAVRHQRRRDRRSHPRVPRVGRLRFVESSRLNSELSICSWTDRTSGNTFDVRTVKLSCPRCLLGASCITVGLLSFDRTRRIPGGTARVGRGRCGRERSMERGAVRTWAWPTVCTSRQAGAGIAELRGPGRLLCRSRIRL